MHAVFREEIGAAVRSASPFLISLVAHEGLTLDEAVMLIEPQHCWPSRPRRLPIRNVYHHVLRHYVAGLHSRGGATIPSYGHRMDRAAGGWFRMEVIDHSLEVRGGIGPVFFETRFGELRVELTYEIPQTILTGSIDLLVEEVIDHAASRGRGSQIVAIKDAALPDLGQMLVVATGSVAYRMPWARQGLSRT